jgi:hypothetical protein
VLKRIVSRDFGVIFLFHWKDQKYVIGQYQVFFNDFIKFKFLNRAGICSIKDLELLILELIKFGGFFAHSDLAGLNHRQ